MINPSKVCYIYPLDSFEKLILNKTRLNTSDSVKYLVVTLEEADLEGIPRVAVQKDLCIYL